jgi:putative ABC transport system substrate-binding protein
MTAPGSRDAFIDPFHALSLSRTRVRRQIAIAWMGRVESLHMWRRDFIGLLGGAAAWPLAAWAQHRVPVIGILLTGAAEASSSKAQIELLRAGMQEVSLAESKDYIFEIRAADNDSRRFPALATELLALHPAVIVAFTNLAITSIQKISGTVPIVGASMNSPVGVGLVSSLSHPGGNVTGVSTMADELVIKSVEIMREILPMAGKVVVVLNPTNASNPIMFETLLRQVGSTGLVFSSVGISSSADLDAAFEEIARQHPDALVVVTDNSLLGLSSMIAARATMQRLPVFANQNFVSSQAGTLVNYSRAPDEAFRAAARLLKRILNGASPADLPVEKPTKFQLTINLKTAEALGLNIPPAVLARADAVIE